MMERFTSGVYRANLHRVRNNSGAERGGRARHSVATFFELEPGYRMVPAPTWAMPVTNPVALWPTIGEHLEAMAQASYAA
jgi:isopenicillin N synthase-like dioxygenase